MATSTVRLLSLSRAVNITVLSRNVLIRSPLPSTVICTRYSGTTASSDNFFERNKQLNRPVSPHLSILLKNPQLQSMMSISHRITGVILSVDVWTVTLAWLASGKTFPQFVETIQSLSIHPYIITGNKVALAFAFTYHFFNSFRHFMWDTGKGFEMNTVYSTGYIVLGAAVLSAIGLALYTPSL